MQLWYFESDVVNDNEQPAWLYFEWVKRCWCCWPACLNSSRNSAHIHSFTPMWFRRCCFSIQGCLNVLLQSLRMTLKTLYIRMSNKMLFQSCSQCEFFTTYWTFVHISTQWIKRCWFMNEDSMNVLWIIWHCEFLFQQNVQQYVASVMTPVRMFFDRHDTCAPLNQPESE